MNDKPAKPSRERRADNRRTALKSGRIVFNKGKSMIDCRIRNVSESGARLEFGTPQLLPHTFELQIPGEQSRLCNLRWAKGNLVGVSFISQG